jgi:hypothetical protein
MDKTKKRKCKKCNHYQELGGKTSNSFRCNKCGTFNAVNWDLRFMYRVRGINPYTSRDVWVTNTWSRTLENAELVKRTMDSRWKNVRIIKKNIGEYMKEKQNIPRFR